MPLKKLVILESPYAGDVEKNIAYARRCLLDSLRRGEAPFMSHLLYTQVLDDKVLELRQEGLFAGWAWLPVAKEIIFCTDLGISPGMRESLELCKRFGYNYLYRKLDTCGSSSS